MTAVRQFLQLFGSCVPYAVIGDDCGAHKLLCSHRALRTFESKLADVLPRISTGSHGGCSFSWHRQRLTACFRDSYPGYYRAVIATARDGRQEVDRVEGSIACAELLSEYRHRKSEHVCLECSNFLVSISSLGEWLFMDDAHRDSRAGVSATPLSVEPHERGH